MLTSRCVSPHCSPKLEEVSYTASSHEDISEALACLSGARALRSLGLTPRNLALSPEHLHVLGSLPLTDLRLNSYVRLLLLTSPAWQHMMRAGFECQNVKTLHWQVCICVAVLES